MPASSAHPGLQPTCLHERAIRCGSSCLPRGCRIATSPSENPRAISAPKIMGTSQAIILNPLCPPHRPAPEGRSIKPFPGNRPASPCRSLSQSPRMHQKLGSHTIRPNTSETLCRSIFRPLHGRLSRRGYPMVASIAAFYNARSSLDLEEPMKIRSAHLVTLLATAVTLSACTHIQSNECQSHRPSIQCSIEFRPRFDTWKV